jgi:hypothetical protein
VTDFALGPAVIPAHLMEPWEAIGDDQLAKALLAGFAPKQIAAQLGCHVSRVNLRIRVARDKHGELWGRPISESAPDDPAAELRRRLASLPPTIPEVRALATHAVAWGLETGTAASASIAKTALAVLESPQFVIKLETETETERRQRLLTTIVHALTAGS